MTSVRWRDVATMQAVALALLGLCALGLRAQERGPGPVLTVEQKKDIQNAALTLENLQLRAQIAKSALDALVAAYTPAGYRMAEDMSLVPVMPPKAP